MKTGGTKCFGCNQGYLNCYQTCPNSPARNNDILLTPIQTPNIDHCDNGYKREMHIKAEVAREIFEEIETLLALNSLQGDVFTGKYFDADLENDIAELKKKYTEA